jgi:hypothetical protein
MAKKVICTCPECIQHYRADFNGQKIRGHKVTQQLRRLHELTAAANRSPDYAKAPNSYPVGIDETFDEKEDGKAKSEGSPGAQHFRGPFC